MLPYYAKLKFPQEIRFLLLIFSFKIRKNVKGMEVYLRTLLSFNGIFKVDVSLSVLND